MRLGVRQASHVGPVTSLYDIRVVFVGRNTVKIPCFAFEARLYPGLRDFQKGLLPRWLADRIKGKSVLWTKCLRDHDAVQDPSESIPNLLVWMPQLASDIKLKGTLVVSDGEIP